MGNPDQVLLADDNEAFLGTVAGVFESHAFRVTQVTDGRAAAALIMKLENLRLVLTDLNMPEMSGADVLRIVRDTRPEVLRVLMSARIGADAEFDASLREQCDPHVLIRKPLDSKVLIGLIESLRSDG